MADTTFISNITRILASWLNDVNKLRYGNGDVTRGDALLEVQLSAPGSVALNLHEYIEDDGSYNVMGFVQQNQKAAIRNHTSTADVYSAFRTALDAVPPPAGSASGGCSVYVPRGKYRLSQTLHINRQGMILSGAGGGTTPATKLMFDVGVPGLLITSKGNPATDYGSWSTICDLGVYGGDSLVYWQITDPHQPTSPVCGINMTRPGRLRNVYVENWKTDGIYIQSESSVSPVDAGLDDANGQQFFTEAAGGYGGTNGWTLENVITQSNGRDGLHVLGGNSNSGYCTNLISNANGRFGIFDQSQISDTYVGCLLELNVYGALRTVAGIVQHLFIGGSIGREGNGPNSYVASSTLFIHCDPGTVIASSPRPRYLQVGSGNFICSTITAKNLEVGEKLITAQLAASSQRGLVMQDDDNPTNSTVDWRYSDTEKSWRCFVGGGFPVFDVHTVDNAMPYRFRFTRGTAMAIANAPTYGTSVAINASLSNTFNITVTNTVAFTIQNPTVGIDGQQITIRIRNTSGGAVGAVTWDTLYKLSAWTSPATGFSRAIDFEYNGTNWIQTRQTGVDVPN